VNTDAPRPDLVEARARVLGIQTKLHRWASDDPSRRFDDLFNLVADPAVLMLAWARVRGNKGARSAGVDGQTARTIEAGRGVDAFLFDLRTELKEQRFRPLPVRERMIPKSGGKWRRLGIPATRDRVVQAALLRHPDDPGPRRAGRLAHRPGAHPGGGFPAVLLRVPTEPACARRDRRGAHARHPGLRPGVRG